MKPTIFLRIASVLTLIHSVLHTIGGVFGKPLAGPAEQAVAAMKSYHFSAMGNARTYWDFYMGLGLGITAFLTTEAIVFWLLASAVRAEGSRLRPVIFAFTLGYVALAANSFRFFFLGPVITEILIALCLILALFFLRELPVGVRTRMP